MEKTKRPKRKRKQKKFQVGRFKINIAAAIANVIALLICVVYIIQFFFPAFDIPKIASMIIPIFFTVNLVILILAFYATRANRLPFIGHLCGGIATIGMLVYPSVAAFVAVVLYSVSVFLLLQKRKYLVYPRRKIKPFYKDATILLAMLAALVLGGSQTAMAIRSEDNTGNGTENTENTRKKKNSDSSSQSDTESTTTATSETTETTSTSTKKSAASSKSSASEKKAESQGGNTQQSSSQAQAQSTFSIEIKITDVKEQDSLGEGDLKMTPEEARFVLLYVNVKNNSKESLFFAPDNLFLVSQSGEEHFFPFTMDIKGVFQADEIKGGAEKSGFIAFEVPSSMALKNLKGQYIGEFAAEEDGTFFKLQKGEVITVKGS